MLFDILGMNFEFTKFYFLYLVNMMKQVVMNVNILDKIYFFFYKEVDK